MMWSTTRRTCNRVATGHRTGCRGPARNGSFDQRNYPTIEFQRRCAMTTAVEVLERPAEAPKDEASDHYYCCDPAVAWCGADISGYYEIPGDLPPLDLCSLCAELELTPDLAWCPSLGPHVW